MKKHKPKVIVVLGPTASGKTKLAVKLASVFDGEIISADSRQVYRGMTIGTGKDLADYCLQVTRNKLQITNKFQETNSKLRTQRIPYHLIDVVSPKTEFNVAKWLGLAKKAIADITKRGEVPFVVGGTGLYISALTEGYNLAGTGPDWELRKRLEKQSLDKLVARLRKLDLQTYKRIDKKNKRRVVRALEVCLTRPEGETSTSRLQTRCKPNYDFLILGVKRSRGETNELIDARAEARLGQGMIEEVERLHKQGVSWRRLDDFGLEYRWISRFLKGEMTREEMVAKLKIEIHRFAKRQMTWFRKMNNIRWVKNYEGARKLIKKWLDSSN